MLSPPRVNGEGTLPESLSELHLILLRAIFDVHIFELTGLEDFAALFALDEFCILVAAHDLHAWMLAGLLDAYVLRRSG